MDESHPSKRSTADGWCAEVIERRKDNYNQALHRFVIHKEEFQARNELESEISRISGTISKLINHLNRLDVLALLKQYEGVVSQLVPTSPSVIEIVATVAQLKPAEDYQVETSERTKVNKIVEKLYWMADLLNILGLFYVEIKNLSAGGPSSDLSTVLQQHELRVRNKQFKHIRDQMNRELLDCPVVRPLMEQKLGYSFSELEKVQNAVTDIITKKSSKAWSEIRELTTRHLDPNSPDLDDKSIAQARAIASNLFETPSSLTTFTETEIAETAGISQNIAAKILGEHSSLLGSLDSVTDQLFRQVTLESPYVTKPLVRDAEGRFFMVTVPPGTDIARIHLESQLRGDEKAQRRYDQKARQPFSEQTTFNILSKMLPSATSFINLKYFRPKFGKASSQLAKSCPTPRTSGDQAEIDCLFLLDDVAIIAEVKGKSISAPGRRGDGKRLARDLGQSIEKAKQQIASVKRLIADNAGLWTEDDQWLDLSSVKATFGIVAMVDDIGPVAGNLEEFRRRLDPEGEGLPWVVSLHDLEVTSDMLETPEDFLGFLTARSSRFTSPLFSAIDELDILAAFMSGKFRIPTCQDAGTAGDSDAEEDPPAFPETLHDDSSVFDTWYLHRQHSTPGLFPNKPQVECSPRIRTLVEQLRTAATCGGLALSAALLSQTVSYQEVLAKHIARTAQSAVQQQHPAGFKTLINTAEGNCPIYFAFSPQTSSNTIDLTTMERWLRQDSLASDSRVQHIVVIAADLKPVAIWQGFSNN